MSSSLDRCLCCSLHQGAVVAGNYAIIAYGAALAVYIWWIIDAQGQVPIPAYVLIALYLVTFVVSVVLVLSLSVQKKTTVLFSWILMMGVFLLPECGLNMWVCIWTLGTSTSKGLGFLVFYSLRAVVNIICMICVHALYTWWKVEKNASKQRIAQIWYGNQQPYYLWNPPMLTYPGYEPSILNPLGEDSYTPPPPRPPRRPKPKPVSAGHLIKHQVHSDTTPDYSRDSPDDFCIQPCKSTNPSPDNLDEFDEPSKDSALGTEPTNESNGKSTQHTSMSPKPTYAFGNWVCSPPNFSPPRRPPPLWRPFAAVPYNNLKALKAAHAQGVHAVPIPPPLNLPPPPPQLRSYGGPHMRSYRSPGFFAPPLPPCATPFFSNGVLPLYGTSRVPQYNRFTFNSSAGIHSQRNYEILSVPKNPIPANTVYGYKQGIEPAFANFIMRQKRGQLGSYRPKSLRGIAEALRTEAMQHVYLPEEKKAHDHGHRRADSTDRSGTLSRLSHIKALTCAAPPDPRTNPEKIRYYGPDVIEDWRTMM